MKTTRVRAAIAVFAFAALACGGAQAKSPEQEDWEVARKASCPDLVDAYKTTKEAERKVVAAIKESKDGTVASNILGVASLAILGVGFFSWDDSSSAEENLADLRNDIKIIVTVASEKKCTLPAG